MSAVIERRTTTSVTAFDFFSRHSAWCAALLEDPAGAGGQWVVSAAGATHQVTDTGDRGGLAAWRQQVTPPPSAGAGSGVFALLYISYEAAGLFEQLPAVGSPSTPLLYAHHPEWSLRFAEGGVVTITATDQRVLDMVSVLLEQACHAARQSGEAHFAIDAIEELGTADGYQRAVERVQEYIAAGDIFQANIARFWQATVRSGDDLALYSRLRRCNPAPFSGIVRLGDISIISASPERLLRITPGGSIDTRPIAGTRKIGSGDESARLRQELLLSAKERAEHVMLVDLERNDLGRICRAGTVVVDESMVVEQYATVQHIVSNVRGELREGVDLVDMLATMFPGGTIT
ncbi:MAG: chorismate-binding protein, partial [Mariprofundales bacterium]|nr:chorismate-binding protein [Mariprofundales bacterium]